LKKTPEEIKWERNRGLELRKELEKDLNIAKSIISEVQNIDPKVTIEVEGDLVDINSIIACIHYTLARTAYYAGDSKIALGKFEEAIKLLPSQGMYFDYGSALLAAGKTSLAIEAFEKCVDIEPESDSGWEASMEISKLQS
jgi:tetratricopeptide (TPR) repeat protein|tara:strand:- start:109 stop:531 length:423 start_codon:yes stop_codon:yes gene_type:complete